MDDKPSGKRGRCAICGEVQPLALDHDHKTAKVRGLICTHCNNGIARFRDDPARLEAAAAYLRNPPGVVGILYYPGSVNRPDKRLRQPNHAGYVRVRATGVWEAKIVFNHHQYSFYSKSRDIAVAKLDTFKQQHGITVPTAA